MLTLKRYKIIFLALIVIGLLVFSVPSVLLAVPSSSSGGFSQLWVLGTTETTSNYPFNVTSGGNNTVYIGLANHLGSVAYYVVEIKLRNQSDSLPDQSLGTPSSLSALYEQSVVLPDGGTWQQQVNFSLSNVSFFENTCSVGTLNIGNVSIVVNKPALWDTSHSGYYYQLFFELWIFNPNTQNLQYNNRYCGLWLNMTSSES